MSKELEVNTDLSHYRIVSKLGEGGMGKVYLAEDRGLRRKVALKFLSAQFTSDGERLARFKLEAQAASALNHPNILTVYETGVENGVHFIAAEFIDGETLRDQLQTKELTIAAFFALLAIAFVGAMIILLLPPALETRLEQDG